MILSKCATCGSKKLRFIKNQETKELISNLGLRTPLSKVIILGDILFWMQFHWVQLRWEYKMNEIVNKFLLAGDKLMPEIYLKQPRFTYSASGPFTKNKERILKFKKTRDTNYIYKNELDKACFQYDMAYGDFKDLASGTASTKIFRNKAYNIAKDPKYGGDQKSLAAIVYKFFNKKSAGSGVNMNAINKNKHNHQLAEELHKPVIKK